MTRMSGRQDERAALGYEHEHHRTCPSIRLRRTVRGVQSASGLEERLAGGEDLFHFVVDRKTQLSFDDVSEHGSRMTVSRTRAWTGSADREVQFDEHDVPPFEGTTQRVSREFWGTL